jgi:hypothetical protein
MKRILNFTIMACALMTIAGSAFGQAVVHIAGSTAFRTSAHASIMDIFQPGQVWCAYDSSSTTYKSGAAIFYGKLVSNGNFVYVKTFWTGSMAGTYDLSNKTIITKWIATPASPPPGGGVIPGTAAVMALCTHDATGGTPNTGTNIHGLAYTTESIAPDAAFSDTDQAQVALSIKTATGGAGFASTITGNPLNDAGTVSPGTVGIVSFVWTAGHQVAALPYTNMTQQNAAALVKLGAIPYGQLSGNGDLSNYAFIVSRNEDSGTRIDSNAEAQTGFGQPVTTYTFNFSGSTTSYVDNTITIQTGGAATATVTGGFKWLGTWPLNTVPSCSWAASGHSGYLGGGDVANVLKSTGDTTSTFTTGKPAGFTNGVSHAALIGSLGTADQANSVGTRLTYNGIPFSVANIQNGTYTLWDFEHFYIRGSAPILGGDSLQACNDLADEVTGTDAPTNGNGKTDNSGATVDVAGTLYDVNCKFAKSSTEGSFEIPNGN